MTAVSREELLAATVAQIEELLTYRQRTFCDHSYHREVSLPQLHILITLQERGPITVSELAHLLHISAPSASSIVDRMEEHELVQRERDVVDRRVVHVAVSEHGRRVVEELLGMKREHLQHLLGAMTDRELRAVLHGVEAVRSALARVHEMEEEGTRAAG